MRRVLPWLCLAVFCFSQASFAQDDDELAPIVPRKPRPAVKAKPSKPRPAARPAAKPVEDDDLSPIASAKGDVNVKLAQGLSNAVLSIDNKDVGPLPIGPQSLTVGEHSVKVRRIGYADFVKRVTVVGGKTIDLEARLTAVSAVLSVTSDVAEAQVFLNGRLVGTAPISELEVPAGAAELSVRKTGFKDDNKRLTLVAGKDYPVVVKFNPGTTTTVVATSDRPSETKLTPDEDTTDITGPAVTTTVDETPVFGRWYFWAGVAAVAVGAAVVTGVVVNNTQPPKPLTEAAVCAVNGGRCNICVGFSCAATGFPSGILSF
jgi:hypothetical protein